MEDSNPDSGTRTRIGDADRANAVWQRVLIEGSESLKLAQRVFRHLPSAPRCKMCHNPFGGVGGTLVGMAGFTPSRKNPNLCARCCDRLPPGGLELDVAVLFADVRGSTALCERVGATVFADLLNRFYRTATDVLINHDAIIDKLVGDEVMALFIPGIAGKDYRRRAAVAAVDLIRALSKETTLPVGAAVDAGLAFVGNVGADHVVDFTALGTPSTPPLICKRPQRRVKCFSSMRSMPRSTNSTPTPNAVFSLSMGVGHPWRCECYESCPPPREVHAQ